MEMSPEQWDKVKELYESALECSPTQRADFLQRISADELVRQEVQRLLAGHEEATSFLSVPPYANYPLVTNQPETRFARGEVLAGRFRIARFIAAGGMGEVYEAEDQELKETLAIKTIRSEILQQSNSLERFKREVRLARKVTHPNICRVYDLFRHERVQGEERSVIVFVSMELLRGETLSQRIRRTGPMAPDEALPLIYQIASGLEAAHRAGVVHRDFKPGNVILVPDGGTSQIRTVITDFGLAVRIGIDISRSSELTAAHGVIGTPAYMAPEQFEGREVTKLTDIYALGLLIQEMVTGVRPFSGDSSLSSSGSTLSGQIVPTKRSSTHLSGVWETTINRCLQRDPASRFSSALEVAKALTDQAPKPLPKHRLGWMPSALGLAIVMTAGLYLGFNMQKVRGFLHGNKSSESETINPVTSKLRPSVAVLSLRNVSGQPDKDWYSTAVSGMLTTELAAGEQLRTVSGEDVAQMTTNLSLPEADGYSKETLQRIHKNLNADVVIVGSYVVLGDGQVRLDLRLQNTSQGVTIASVSEKGREEQIDDLVGKAGAQLREKLGVGTVSLAEAAAVRATLPSSTEAARLYAEGIAKLREFDNVAARDLFQKVVLEDPNFALAHSALASAYSALGYDEKARQSARNAFELSSGLSREDRLLIEARYREANKEWDHAVESYQALFGYFSDNLEYGIMLAGAQIHGGNAKQALKTIESLRRLPASAREDPRIDLKTAEAYFSLGEFGKAQALASAATEKARTINAKLILADSLFRGAQASENLNQTTEAMTSVEEAERIYNAAGNRSGEARSLEVMAIVLAGKGDLPGALAKYQKQLSIARDIGNRRLEASALNNMGLVLKDQGDPEGARKMYEQALLGFRDISDKANTAQVLVNIGGVLLEEGDLAGAKQNYEKVLSISQEVNDQNGVSTATAGLGTVLDAQGDLAGAKKLLDHAIEIDLSTGMKNPPADKLAMLGDVLQHQGNLGLATKAYGDSLTQSRDSGEKSNAAYALMGLGQVALETADFKESRKNYEEALIIRRELGEKRSIAATQAALAEQAVEEGHPSDGLTLAKSAYEQFRSLRSRDEELAAVVVLSRALLLQGKTSDAARELSAQAPFAAKSQNPASKIEFELASARVQVASGKAVWGNAPLKTALGNAMRLGLVKYQLECRLAIEEAAARAGKSPQVRAQLDQLENDARGKGFSLIARRVSEITNHW
jgi:serine/threonine protein kinase/tetratricopeptide (TPR) repeat protein